MILSLSLSLILLHLFFCADVWGVRHILRGHVPVCE